MFPMFPYTYQHYLFFLCHFLYFTLSHILMYFAPYIFPMQNAPQQCCGLQVLKRAGIHLETQLLEVPAGPKLDPYASLTSDIVLSVKPFLAPALMSISTFPSQNASDMML